MPATPAPDEGVPDTAGLPAKESMRDCLKTSGWLEKRRSEGQNTVEPASASPMGRVTNRKSPCVNVDADVANLANMYTLFTHDFSHAIFIDAPI